LTRSFLEHGHRQEVHCPDTCGNLAELCRRRVQICKDLCRALSKHRRLEAKTRPAGKSKGVYETESIGGTGHAKKTGGKNLRGWGWKPRLRWCNYHQKCWRGPPRWKPKVLGKRELWSDNELFQSATLGGKEKATTRGGGVKV